MCQDAMGTQSMILQKICEINVIEMADNMIKQKCTTPSSPRLNFPNFLTYIILFILVQQVSKS